jgi:hypothetical protein
MSSSTSHSPSLLSRFGGTAIRVVATTVLAALLAVSAGAASASAAEPGTIPSSVAVQTGMVRPANWFSDWQTCIWGIGVPTALALRNPVQARQMALSLVRNRPWAVARFGERTVSACIRFINS